MYLMKKPDLSVILKRVIAFILVYHEEGILLKEE